MFRLDLGKFSTNGGFLSPTLAAILYQTSLGDFVYQTDSNGNVVLDNQGTLTSAYDGLPYSGRGIELGATNDVNIPIHHTLGADNKKLASSVDAGWTDNLDNTYTGSTVTGDIVGLTTLTSGTFKVTITLSSVTAGDVNGYTADGTYVFEETLTASLNLTGTGFTGIVTIVSVEQITNPNSFLTYYDFTDGLITLGNSVDGGSSEELSTNGDFSDGETGWINQSGNFSVSSSQLLCDTADNAQSFYQTGKVTVGNSHYIVINIDAITTGYVTVSIGVVGTTAITTSGTHIFSLGSAINTNINIVNYLSDAIVNSLSVREILPISTKYTLNTKTVNNILTHATNWNASDWAKINNNHNLIGKLALETTGATKTIPELDMVMDAGASADKWFMCADRQSGTLTCARTATNTTISNWVSTIETNADLQQSGIQTTAFVLDANGVPTAYSSNLLQFNGDGRYVDTGWIPSATDSYTIESVVYLPKDGIMNSDFGANGSNIFDINTSNIISFYGVIDRRFSTSYSAGLNHLIGIYDYLTNSNKFYLNGIEVTNVLANISTQTSSFRIGKRGTSPIRYWDKEIGLPKIYTKALTSTEVATAYAQAKTIYPTLP